MKTCATHKLHDSGRFARLGHTKHQLWYSAEIVADPTHPNRLIEAYKWAFIAWFLGEDGAEQVSHYLRSAMPAGDPEKAIQQAEEWLDDACEDIRKGQGIGWSDQMLRIAAGELLPHQVL